MLGRQNAIDILHEHGRGAAWTGHCFAVAEAAAAIGAFLASQRSIDMAFLWSASLLHDIGRHVTHDPVLHGIEGYKLLSEIGHAEEARVCASHILFGLRAEEAVRFGLPERDFIPRTVEEQLVALVDLLIEFDRPTTLERRFASLRRRNGGNSFFLERLDRAYASAASVKAQIEDDAGEALEQLIAIDNRNR